MAMASRSIQTRFLGICAGGAMIVAAASIMGLWFVDNRAVAFGIEIASVALAFAAVVYSLSENITAPVAALRQGLDRLAHGDFSMPFATSPIAEIQAAAASAEQVRAHCGSMMSEVRSSAIELSAALKQLSGTATQAAENSRKQSEDAISMATVVEMMTYNIDSMAGQAEQVQSISANAGELSNRGGEVIHNTVAEMGRIAESVNESSTTVQNLERQSDKIGTIVKVIKEIADQTNLLALNAAIEAARAGEQGRGFAVVADEVRKLAERTAKSTEEIAQVIQSIQADTKGAVRSMQAGVSQVQEGASLAAQAGAAINEIKAGAVQVVQAVNEISEALKQQSTTNSENSHKVERIAQMSQENCVVIEGIASTTLALDGIAGRLQAVVKT